MNVSSAAIDLEEARQLLHEMVDLEYSLPWDIFLIDRWAGFHMANTDNWYFAYTIDDDTIVVHDACHAQNMHDPQK
jgi:uncharacterized protein YqjF (DUF2071 family)